MILINSVFRAGNNYYPQVFLEQCKYVIKDKKINNCVTDDVEISSGSDEDNSNEQILEKNQMKKNSDEEDSSEEKIFFSTYI